MTVTGSPHPRTEPSRFASPPKAIIFDIGRVIVRIELSRLLEPLASLASSGRRGAKAKPPAPHQVWNAIESDALWPDWQEGRLTSHRWHEHLTTQLGLTIGFDDFCATWNRALDPEPLLADSLFERLGRECRLALLSNTDPLHVAHLESHFTFMRYFPVRIYSCRVGARKPAPAIFAAALSGLRVEPAQALYIDDMPEYVAAALEFGIDAIRFENPGRLMEELATRGVL